MSLASSKSLKVFDGVNVGETKGEGMAGKIVFFLKIYKSSGDRLKRQFTSSVLRNIIYLFFIYLIVNMNFLSLVSSAFQLVVLSDFNQLVQCPINHQVFR